MSIKRVRIQDASIIKSVLGLDTVAAAESYLRRREIYSDESYKVLAKCSFTSGHAVIIRFRGEPDDSFVDSLISFFFFEKHIYKISVIIHINDKNIEEALLNNGFLQEAVLHEELLINGSYEDAGLFYITMPMYKRYNVGFLPFQRGVIAVSGGNEYVDDISFLRFDEEPKNDYLKLCADHAGLVKEGKLKPRGDKCYESFTDFEMENLPFEVSRALGEIREYLLKQRETFDITVKLPKTSAFRLSVWNCIKTIPYGYTVSYEDIALKLTGGDIKKASKLTRAVGHACAENPVPIIIPCHRVIGKNGKLIGFKDGIEFKDFLLTHELFAALPLA